MKVYLLFTIIAAIIKKAIERISEKVVRSVSRTQLNCQLYNRMKNNWSLSDGINYEVILRILLITLSSSSEELLKCFSSSFVSAFASAPSNNLTSPIILARGARTS